MSEPVASFKRWPPSSLHAVARYLALGGLAAAVNWGSRFAWERIMPFWAAVPCAYATGMVVAFSLFRAFVFPRSPSPLGRQIRNFVLVNLVGVAQTFIVSIALVDWIAPAIGWTYQTKAIGHGVAIAVPALTSWFGHRYLTFPSGAAAPATELTSAKGRAT